MVEGNKNKKDIENLLGTRHERAKKGTILNTMERRDYKSISDKLVMMNRIDICSIKGVGEKYSNLLESAGVDTARDLARRNPANLHQKILEVNQEKKLVRQTPTLSMVEKWIKLAKGELDY